MLKISRLSDYSVVILNFLGKHIEQRFSAAALAEHIIYVPAPTVSKILKLLNEAGLLTSTRGVNGGYQIAKPPQQISVAEIITVIDGKPAVTQCSLGDNICEHEEVCELRGNWQLINNVIYDVLNNITLADMRLPLVHSQIKPMQFYKLAELE